MRWPTLAETFCPSFARFRDTSFCELGDWLAWPAQFPPKAINKASATKMEVIIEPQMSEGISLISIGLSAIA